LTGGTAGAARFIHVANPDTTLNVGVALGTIGPLVKAGDGFLSLTGTSSQIGATDYTFNAGTLRASMTNFPNATGGLRLRGGVLEITGGSNGTGVSADFTRAISTTSATGLNWTGTTSSDRGSGGFSAFGSNASVNIGGSASPTTLTWNSGNFVADGYALIFGSTQSDARLTFLNPIALGTPATSQGYGLREFRVIDNPNSTADITTLAGAITGSDARVDLLKTGGGTLELTATNTYTGATLATGGTLRLAGASGKLATSSFNLGNGTVFEIDNSANNLSGRLTASGGPKLTLGGAAVRLVGNNSSTASETFNGLTLNPGSSSIAATNANSTISLGNISRTTAGGTVAFSTTGTINTSASLTNGIIGGFASIGDDWATTSGGQVVAYSGYVLSSSAAASTWTATDNVKVVDAQSLLASGQAYSANFAGGSLTTAAGRTFTVGSGGILATASGSITGGILTANNAAQGSDIIATVNGSNVFTIGSTISDNGGAVGLTKSGTGTLVLTGTNLYTGRTTIGQGMLAGTGTVSGAATVLSGAVIRGGIAGTTGTLTVANSLTFVKGATLQVEASRTGAGTANASKIDVTGDGHVLNLNPGSIIGERIAIDLVSNASNPLLLNETYTLTLASVPAAGNIRLNGVTLPDNAAIDPKLYSLHSADFSNFSNVSLAIDNSGQNLLLTFTPVPVPEPASVVALAAGGLFAARIVRRRKP
ncbi:MAG TPA: autotransporter-associated beta strand repeat-containing protein, partial [Gemmata sp.]|nr:autotransporter-associated beta strand repeat-containing protein [Gemmata sp.]